MSGHDINGNRPGYKETKVGWIPEEWECQPLSSLATLQTGIAKGKAVGTDPIELPYLRVANVQDGAVVLSEVKTITVSSKDVDRYSLAPNDVLFTEGGDFDKLGRGCVWSGQIQPCLHQNHVFAVRCNSNALIPALLAAFASGPQGRRYFALNSKQSTNLASINSTQLKAFPIPTPPLREQKKIAEILSTCDEVIEKTGALIEAKKRQKKAFMQQLLTGEKRLPGFAGEWDEVVLSEISKRLKKTAKEPAGYPVLSITAGRGFVSQADKFSRIIAGKQVEKYVVLKRGEFSYNKGNSYRYPQGCVYRMTEYDKGLVPNVFYSFRLNETRADAEFIKQYFLAGLHNGDLYRWINSGVRNNGLLNLNSADFFKLPIKMPPLSEQAAIGEILRNADGEIQVIEAKHAALKKQKKALMQQLLTGHVRVKV